MQMETPNRGLAIHFVDGSKIHIEFPVQALNETGALLRLEEILKQRQIIAEVDGAVVLIPFDNIKYIQVYPSSPSLPRYAILGASIRD
jgi:hypothetical protein